MTLRSKNILTQSQSNTLEALKRYIDMYGQSPTLEELARALGIALPTAVDRVRGLIKKGYVVKDSRRWRNLRIARHEGLTNVPLAFSVGADNLSVFSNYNFGHFVQVDQSLLRGHRDVFAVRVVGDSMRDAGIAPGSLVLAEEIELSNARDGERVIALIGDMITLKRLKLSAAVIILEPENTSAEYPPIVISRDREDFKIIGRVLSVMNMNLEHDEDEMHFVPEP